MGTKSERDTLYSTFTLLWWRIGVWGTLFAAFLTKGEKNVGYKIIKFSEKTYRIEPGQSVASTTVHVLVYRVEYKNETHVQ